MSKGKSGNKGGEDINKRMHKKDVIEGERKITTVSRQHDTYKGKKSLLH